MKKREFLGRADGQKLILYPVFSGSPLSVISPIEAPPETYLLVEGPQVHLKFLFPYLVRLVKQAPADPDDMWGTWTGVESFEHTGKLTLFYHHGKAFADRALLLEHHFRRDIVFYSDLRLSEVSFLELCYKDTRVNQHRFVVIGLPEELEQNGSIEFPLL